MYMDRIKFAHLSSGQWVGSDEKNFYKISRNVESLIADDNLVRGAKLDQEVIDRLEPGTPSERFYIYSGDVPDGMIEAKV